MMSWQEQIGTKKTGTPLTMDAERIEKYRQGIAEPEGPVVPPLIVATVIIPTSGLMLGDIQFDGLNISRIVHGGIDLKFARMVELGDTLTCTCSFAGLEEKSSGTLINFDFDVRDQNDASTCTGVTRYFIRGDKKGSGKSADTPSPQGEPTAVSETVPDGLSRLYAEGSGDVFPIHTSKSFAQSVGLPDVILHGMCTLAIAMRGAIQKLADGDASKLKELTVRFSKMVFHGDTLTTEIHPDGAFETKNQRGQAVLKAGRAVV